MKRHLSERHLWLRAIWCSLLLTACGGEALSTPAPGTATVARASVTADAGPPVHYAYDEARRLVAVYDGMGGSAQYVY
ncbi:hypothetical protein, partial [Myxococcus sp. RHSTA-1-4]|uniref:hypothetical protein n=1 Tax=Myxococcus sp. RHSTA-1-4 TaxID=2874601 RepID=UPI001CBB3865